MDTKDVLTIVSICISALIGLVGFILTIIQLNKSKNIKEVDFVSNLIFALRTNSNISNAFYLIEYNCQWYDDNFHNGGEVEKNMDALLSQLDYLCYAKERKLISKKAFNYFNYVLTRVINDFQVRSYLWNLYHWTNYLQKECSFKHLINYMKSKFSFEQLENFNNKNSNIYIKQLYS